MKKNTPAIITGVSRVDRIGSEDTLYFMGMPVYRNVTGCGCLRGRKLLSLFGRMTEYVKDGGRDKAAGDTAVRFEITDPWIKARVTVEDGRMIPPGGFEIVEIPNVQTAVAEVKYRGWWLWRRSVGLTLHVRNSNPHVRVTEGVFVDLRKRK